jgi:hypothetical protein
LARFERYLVPIGALIFALAFTWPLLHAMHSPVTGDDWDTMLAVRVDSYRQVMMNHILPLDDPWRCGGISLWGNPQSMVGGLGFWLDLVFGPFFGTRLEVILSLAIGAVSSYFLGRTLKLRPLSSAVIAGTFCASSWYFMKIVEGHTYAMATMYEPAILAFILRGWRWRAALAIVAAMLGGSPNIMYGLLAISLWCGLKSLTDWRLAPATTCAIVLGLAFWLFLPKFIPMLEFNEAHPRPTDGYYMENNPPKRLAMALFDRNMNFRDAPNGYGWWELGAYIGWFGLLAGVGAVSWRQSLPWALTAAGMLVLAHGHGLTAPSVWDHLHDFPIFDHLRIPSRFMVQVALMVAVMAGYGAERLANAGLGALVFGVVTIGLLDCWYVDAPLLKNMNYNLSTPELSTEPFHKVGHESMLQASIENAQGTYCYEYFAQ